MCVELNTYTTPSHRVAAHIRRAVDTHKQVLSADLHGCVQWHFECNFWKECDSWRNKSSMKQLLFGVHSLWTIVSSNFKAPQKYSMRWKILILFLKCNSKSQPNCYSHQNVFFWLVHRTTQSELSMKIYASCLYSHFHCLIIKLLIVEVIVAQIVFNPKKKTNVRRMAKNESFVHREN